MPILASVPRHHDFLRRFAFPKLPHKLCDGVFLQERMIHRINEHRCGSRNALHCTEKGTQLSLAPPPINYHLRRSRHNTAHSPGIASEHHDGTFQARTILDCDQESRFLPELCNRPRHAQFFGAACGENDRNNLGALSHAEECGRINDDDANS